MAWRDVNLKPTGRIDHSPTRVPLAFKAMVLALKYNKRLTAREAIKSGLAHFPTFRPAPSYFSAPSSHIYRFRKEFERAAGRGDPEVIGFCRKHGLEFQDWVEE